MKHRVHLQDNSLLSPADIRTMREAITKEKQAVMDRRLANTKKDLERRAARFRRRVVKMMRFAVESDMSLGEMYLLRRDHKADAIACVVDECERIGWIVQMLPDRIVFRPSSTNHVSNF